MPEPVEVAILLALLSRAQAFATSQALTISMPNVEFTPPAAKTGNVFGKYLRATVLPAPSVETGISFNAHLQHYGLMQIDAFVGIGAGEPVLSRIAAAATSYFKRGTVFTSNDISMRVTRAPYLGPLMIDGAWAYQPVSIPYLCFARPA